MSDVYEEALNQVDRICEETIQEIERTADMYHYEKDWLLDRFQEQFRRKKGLRNEHR